MTPESTELDLLIDGRWVPGIGWSARENPARITETVGRVAQADAELAEQAVLAAHRAWPAWRAMPVHERASRLVAALRAAIEENPRLPELLARELGKVLPDCVGELASIVAWTDYVALHAPGVLADEQRVAGHGRLMILNEPFGVVSAITPWNAPLALAFMKVSPALVAGNTMVIKPSPLAPLAITTLAGAVARHLPAGVLNVVNGGAAVGTVMTTHALVRKVVFTGGLETARHIAASAASSVKPTVLELGGNDPAIFLPGARFDDVTMERIVRASFLTTGQVCMAAKRLFVPHHRLPEFVEAYVRVAGRVLTLGDPLEPGVTVGPMVSRDQVDRVAALLADTKDRGAECIELGEVGPGVEQDSGYWLRPTLVVGATDEHQVVAEEQFGPTVPVLGYDNEDEVVARANAGELGLASSVWDESEDTAVRVARRLDVGYTFINCHARDGMTVAAPFGGWRQSGYGREYGPEGIKEYTQSHVIHAPRLPEPPR